MGIGFDCDDGWFDLVWTLSRALDKAASRDGLEPSDEAWPEATQVKQKFGSLRFRIKNGTREMEALIGAAQAASETICEICGAPGAPVRNPLVKTLCPDHAHALLYAVV